ncbi:MAG: hypothetical protein K2W94_07175 [Alphaproteobacteria bacterium]|nr:hypothetical protein [Alphaproteobacteria bacterium]
MKTIKSLLLIALYLSFTINTQASGLDADLESGLERKGSQSNSIGLRPVTEPFALADTVAERDSSLRPTTSKIIAEPVTALQTPSSLKDFNQQPVSGWRRFVTWGERITGNALSIIGIPISAAGGTLVAVYPELSDHRAQAGVALAGFGVFINELGKILLEDSRAEGAEIEKAIKIQTRKIAESADLTPEEVDRLSDEFFGMSQAYQSYIGCASKADRVMSRMLSLVGPTAAVTGAVLTLLGELTVGPILAVGGASAISVRTSLQERADAHDAQLKRFQIVSEAKEKARTKLKSSSGSDSTRPFVLNLNPV